MYYKPSPVFEDILIDKIYTIHYFEYYKDYQFKGESHDFWEILYVDKGEVLVTGGSRHLIMRAGQLIFHKPGEFHSIAANGVIAPNTIVFSFDCSSPAMSYFEDKILYADDEIKDLIPRIIAETKAVYENDLNDPLYRELRLRKEYPFGGCQVIKLYLELLLIAFIRKGILAERYKSLTTVEHNFSSKKIFTGIVNYIENNMTKQLTISDICRISTVNRSSLERIFKNTRV
jgi:mannose-6-phosphate isomerase-like protein (cupin superfamily)